jgi:NAD(P)-dependent dehydrogenase (short-subunit alcohol dehydrogenase family)
MASAGRNQPHTGTALVTGAAKRIGRAIALDLGSRGWQIAVHYNTSGEAAAEVVAEIEAAGGRATAFAADLAGDGQAAALIPQVSRTLAPPTCLINNASIFERDSLETVDNRSWDGHQAVNLRAPMVLTKAFAAALPAGTRGNVINLIDQRVLNQTPYFLSYTVSKAGLWALTKATAMELAPGTRVNAIGPGPVLPSTRQSEQDFARQQAATPLRRGPEPAEICAAVRFILETPSMTGQLIALDGGQHLGWATPGAGEPRE